MPTQEDSSLDRLTIEAVRGLAPTFGLPRTVPLPTITIFSEGSNLYNSNKNMRDLIGASTGDCIFYNRTDIDAQAAKWRDAAPMHPLFYKYRTVGEEAGHYLHMVAQQSVPAHRIRIGTKAHAAALNLCELLGGLASAVWVRTKCKEDILRDHLATALLTNEDPSHRWGYEVARALFETGMPVPIRKLARCRTWKEAEALHYPHTGIRAEF